MVTPWRSLIQLILPRWFSIAGFAQALAFSSVSSTKMWRCTPSTIPPENSGFGCAALPPRLANAALKVSMLVLANWLAPRVTKCSPSSPAQVEPSAPDDPYQNAGGGRGHGAE